MADFCAYPLYFLNYTKELELHCLRLRNGVMQAEVPHNLLDLPFNFISFFVVLNC